MMVDLIDGRVITPEAVPKMGNCRLRKTKARLDQLLMLVEQEIEGRMGQGGGGLSQ